MTLVDSKFAKVHTTISTYRTARLFLMKRGTKVAIQNKADGPYVYVEKTDFIKQLRRYSERANLIVVQQDLTGPTDYDGNREEYLVEDNVLHVPYGVF